MNATEHMKHWRSKSVWRNLENSKHQRRLHRCADLAMGQTFIDVGCAFGHSTDHMARHRPAFWYGMDFDEGAILEARKLFPQYPFYFSRDYNMADVTGKGFDTVICSEVIEHVPDERTFIDGLSRLAIRRIVLTTPTVDAHDPGHLRIHTRETLERLFRNYRARIFQDSRFFYIVVDLRPGE